MCRKYSSTVILLKNRRKKRKKKSEGTSAFIETSNVAYTDEMCHYSTVMTLFLCFITDAGPIKTFLVGTASLLTSTSNISSDA